MHSHPKLRFLVIEGNERGPREAHRESYGKTSAQSYADVVRGLEPYAICDIALPADEGANLPDSTGLEAYDGVFITGSSLNIYTMTPPIQRQIELMRAVLAAQVPVFGSCWGVQLGAVAAGGTVHKNPRGREAGFARRITVTEAGINHPLLAGRPRAFDAPAIHEDEIAHFPGEEMTVLAANGMSPVQAAEIRTRQGGVFWGVQYHPEFSLAELASILRRRTKTLVAEGFVADEASAHAHCDELEALHRDPARRDLAWKHALDDQVLDEAKRLTELRNFITHRVKPHASARLRA